MAACRDHKKRGDVSIKLPYNSPENYVRRPRDTWRDKSRPVSQMVSDLMIIYARR